MTPDHVHVEPDPYAPEQPVSISRIAHTLQRYAGVIAVALATVILLYLIVAAAWWLFAPSQRVTSMRFRLEFKGAEAGEYPNGLKFSTADITSTPVLLEVYNTNNLSRFMRFDEFSRSVIVLESNQALERLMSEYQAKLADPKLTPVDRDRLERDFDSRRASISKADYAIQLVAPAGTQPVPSSVRAKILHDTLKVWARKAAVEKRALDYQVPVLSTNVLSQIRIESDNYLIPLLLLRKRLSDLKQNVDDIAAIPGAQLVRTAGDRVSLGEIDLLIDEIIRYRIEPLIATARSLGLLGSPNAAVEVLRAQLSYDERLLSAARRREEALRRTLAAYESQQATDSRDPEPVGRENRGRASETVMPQLTDSFLERIVDLSNRNADREYRQRLTDEIKQASLAVIPAEMSVQYDRELIDSFQRGGANPDPAAAAALRAQWESVLEEVRQVITRVNEIYTVASRQLYPETELYRTLGPAVTRTQRGISPTRLALWGVLTFLIALPLIITGVLLHNRVREEEAIEAEAHAHAASEAVTQT